MDLLDTFEVVFKQFVLYFPLEYFNISVNLEKIKFFILAYVWRYSIVSKITH